MNEDKTEELKQTNKKCFLMEKGYIFTQTQNHTGVVDETKGDFKENIFKKALELYLPNKYIERDKEH